jgi:hypothetical protein
MSRVFVTMAMSLDGFITGPDDNAQNPAGTNGMRRMDWLGIDQSGQLLEEDADGGGGGEKWRPRAGVLDAIEIQLRPVLLGQGRRLFEGLPAQLVELDLVRVLEAPGTLHLRYAMKE